MAYIQPRSTQHSGWFIRLTYWLVRRRLGKVPAPIGITAHNRWVLAAVGGFELAMERAHVLDTRAKELVTLKTAMEIGCRFCIDIGTALARQSGITDEELRALPFHEQGAAFSELERRMLDYAARMTRSPMTVPKPLFDSLRDALGDAGLVELTATIAWENYRARFNHAMGATEEGFSEGSLCLLPPHGATATVSA